MKTRKRWAFLSALAALWAAGCVSIYDNKVQVLRPDQVDNYNRSILQQCTPHVYPHRLIQATTGAGYPYLNNGGAMIGDQDTFDKWWAGLSVQLDQDKVVTDRLKPVVDWNLQTAFFMPMALAPCQRVQPAGDGMTTDCYNITIPLYSWKETANCQETVPNYYVYVYIFPKATGQPVGVQWTYPTPIPTATALPTSTPTRVPTATPVPEEDE